MNRIKVKKTGLDERTLRAVFESAPVGILVKEEKSGKLKYANARICEMLGYEKDKLLKLRAGALHPLRDRKGIMKTYRLLSERKGKVARNIPILRKDGSVFYSDMAASPRKIDGKKCSIIFFLDTTERKEYEDGLAHKEELFRKSQKMTKTGTWELDIKTGRLYWSDEVYRIFDVKPREFEGTYESFLEHVHPEDRKAVGDAFSRSLRKRKNYDIVHRIITKSGEVKYVNEKCETCFAKDGRALRSIGTIQDITERKKAEMEKELLRSQLMQSQKMEAMGILAGGVAHDFNNILTGIGGDIDLILGKGKLNEELRKDLESMKKSVKKASGIVRQLLIFSRRELEKKEPLDLEEIIRNSFRMLRRMVNEKVKMEIRTAGPCVIMGDPVNINQVLMNLAINSSDAMPSGGNLKISLEPCELKAEDMDSLQNIRPGKYAKLTVKDTGGGIKPEIMDKIFDPFFTTKGVGKGTGLGLPVVLGIARSHNAGIRVESRKGEGTEFSLYFPLREGRAGKRKKEKTPGGIRKGRGRILVVEDDSMVRDVTERILQRGGYLTFSAGNCAAAEKLYKKHSREIDLVICDMVLPDGNGMELAEKLGKIKRAEVIYMSGYFDQRAKWETIKKKNIPFLQKPFSLNQLLETVGELLKKSGRGKEI